MAFFPFTTNPYHSYENAFRQFQENQMRAMRDAYRQSTSYAEAQSGYDRPRQHSPGQHNVHAEKDCFRIELDVHNFTPDEISVKVTDNYIVVKGDQSEKPDNYGLVSRSFARRYVIPDGAEVELISSELSSDGILIVSVPMKKSAEETTERVIPIKPTGAPAKMDTSTAGTSQSSTEK